MISEAIKSIGQLAIAANGNELKLITEQPIDGGAKRVTITDRMEGKRFEQYIGPGLNFCAKGLGDFVAIVNDIRRRGVDAAKLPPIMVGDDGKRSYEAGWQYDPDRNLSVRWGWDFTKAYSSIVGQEWRNAPDTLYVLRRVLNCDAHTVQMFRQVKLRNSSESSVVIDEGRQRESLGRQVEREAAGLPETIFTGLVRVFDVDDPEMLAAQYELDVVVNYEKGTLCLRPAAESVENAERVALGEIAQRIRDLLPDMCVVSGSVQLVKA